MSNTEYLEKLIAPGVLGFYKSCEVTMCCLYDKKEKIASNLYTIFSFEDREVSSNSGITYLTERNEHVDRKKEIALIVAQACISIEEALKCSNRIEQGARTLEIVGEVLNLSSMSPVPSIFVPVNGTKSIPLNRVIKNNFNAGSMLIEWFGEKDSIKCVLDSEELKKAELRIQELLPIDLFTINDRIGNVVFQVPSEISWCKLSGKEEDSITCEFRFDRRIRDLSKYILYIATDLDDVLIGSSTICETENETITLKIPYTGGPYIVTLMDTVNHIPVYQQTVPYIRKMPLKFIAQGNRDTIRTIKRRDGTIDEVNIGRLHTALIGGEEFVWEEAIKQRQYNEKIKELMNAREFVRYYGKDPAEREKALGDLRSIMRSGIEGIVYLWDPYLEAQDLLDTWYYVNINRAKLRVISSSSICPKKDKNSVGTWINEQNRILRDGSNQLGISLNWRIQHGEYGFGFHDRFIILKRKNQQARVWSLGTSINSFGKNHHILQLVSNPEYILEDFETLWAELDDPSCQVWNSER